MERVNLIPDDLILTWNQRLLSFIDRHTLPVLGGVLAAVCLIAGGLAISQGLLARRYTAHVASLEAKRANLVAELENAGSYVSQLNQAEQQLNQQLQRLAQRIGYLNTYRDTPGEWAVILQELKRALPYGVWLTELEGNTAGPLRMAGGAFSDALVSQFMGQLKSNPRFSNVAFTFTRQDKIGRTGIVVFELTCQLVMDAPRADARGASIRRGNRRDTLARCYKIPHPRAGSFIRNVAQQHFCGGVA